MSTIFNQSDHSRPKRGDDKWWTKKWVPFAAVGIAGMLIGSGLASSGKPETVEAAPTPAVTVTATPSPAPTVTKTVEVTPQACLTYVTKSEQGFNYASEAMGYMGDALTAASAFDVAGLTAASDKIAAVNPKMKALAPESNAAKAECVAGAK